MYKVFIRILGCSFMFATWVAVLSEREIGVADTITCTGVMIAAAILMR